MNYGFIFLMLLICGCLCLGGCGGKYSDVIEVNDQYIEAMESFISDLEKADTPKAMAAGINSFTDKMEEIGPQMAKIAKKYPELKDQSSLPKELKETQARAEEVGKRFAGAFMKIMRFMESDEVRKAQARLQTSMQGMMQR